MKLPNRMTTALQWLRGDAEPLSRHDLSQTIGFARIALIAGLVFLHYEAYPNSTVSPFDGMDLREHPYATFANSFVLFFFFSVVPLLSMVSGWLFFTFAPDDAVNGLWERIRRRLGSLYLPLVFWNVLYVLLAVALFRFAPGYSVLHELNIDLEHAAWRDYMNAMLGLTRHPVAFQFWFVRDLLVTVLISPALWMMLRYAPLTGATVLGAAWVVGHDLGIFFRSDVAFFFYLGALLRVREADLRMSGRATVTLLAIYCTLVALRVLAPMFIEVTPHRPEWLDMATRTMRLVGVLACWGMCVRLARTPGGARLAQYSGLSFFLFATHFPLIAAVKHAFWTRLPAETDAWMMGHYMLSVLVTIATCLAAGIVFAHAAPNWFALMNGGRLIPMGGATTGSPATPTP